ncbi:RDD family protein [uncultured Dokdonia sp.]|uniref:RDD family protein n=1 Tax=uncultured Dokdonia sp. TaxID=575653 RepID=UPI00260A78B9|nr:RDD family protein [uncultured Dokdonia sp.]
MTFIETQPHIGRRIVAGSIDYTIIYALSFFTMMLLGVQVNFDANQLNNAFSLIPIGFWILMAIIIEITAGATIGNLIVGLRAIPINGQYRKLTFLESLKRHLLDPVDMFFFGLVGIIVMKNTPYNQRIGDLWAKTMVIK